MFLSLLHLPRVGEIEEYHYELGKIKSYLAGYKSMSENNIPWRYDEQLRSFKNFSNKYVSIDEGITFDELQLLIDVALFSYLDNNNLI